MPRRRRGPVGYSRKALAGCFGEGRAAHLGVLTRRSDGTMARHRGFEPLTPSSGGSCSIQLS